MRVAHINVTSDLSTGRIAAGICENMIELGHRALLCHSRGLTPENTPSYRIGGRVDRILHVLLSRVTDRAGFYSRRATRKLVKQLQAYAPDVVHLHNLHGYYLHLPTLFAYLRKAQVPVVWTLHDCWPFTGHCAYFDAVGCPKWQSLCTNCPQKKAYPKSFVFSQSKRNYLEKQALFLSLPKLTLVTPSGWLNRLVGQSFLGERPAHVIYNGINLQRFKPTPRELRRHHGIQEPYIILAVAYPWDSRKGLHFIESLPAQLTKEFRIVVVGLTQQQIEDLPRGILGLARTAAVETLCAWYTTADCFINPTIEDNLPTVNLEALACGTPVATFDTGGCAETVDEACGAVVPRGDVKALAEAAMRLCREKPAMTDACMQRAWLFDSIACTQAYAEMYEALLGIDPQEPSDTL